VTADQLAASLGLAVREVDAALVALETEGVVLRGNFTPGLSVTTGAAGAAGATGATGDDEGSVGNGAAPLEWCHRRLLARIHRYTIDRLRAEIEPASAADFMRFLFTWQHADPGARLDGPRGLLEVLAQLQGYEAPAISWERDILPARVAGYQPAWLDELCLSGQVAWARLVPPSPATAEDGRERPRSGPVRNSPVAFFLRQDAETWTALAPASHVSGEGLSSDAWAVATALRLRGASFIQDLAGRTGLLLSQIERALGELVALGLVTSDSFSGLRALISPLARRPRRARPRGGRPSRGVSSHVAGRWSLVREAWGDGPGSPAQGETAASPADGERLREESVERLARQLLARYGVVVRRMLDREPLLPPWRELLRVLRRLEMRGEIRGGRFLQGAAGEQFALPEAVDLLRSVRRREPGPEMLTLSGGDPLNLTGLVTPGARVPAVPYNRVAYRAGVPVAVKEGKEIRLLRDAEEPGEEARLRAALERRLPEAAFALGLHGATEFTTLDRRSTSTEGRT
jgi:ATP-dependent Lhr-like helicase